MAFDWNAYPDAGGMTGANIYLDPSQTIGPGGPIDPGRGVVLQNPSPTSPMQGGGGITGGNIQGGPGTVSGGNSQDPQAFFNQLFPGNTLTPQDLAAHEAELKAQGITLIRNASGQPSKIRLPDGTVVDPIIGAGSGQNQKAWNVIAGPGGVPMGGGSLGSLGFSSGAFVSPIGQFTPPSAADAMNSPGTQYSIDEAMRTLQNSAAAKGELLNGRVLQGELGAISNLAAGQYNDVYNRAANTFGINFGVQARNQDAPFNKYLSLAQLGQGAAAAS